MRMQAVGRRGGSRTPRSGLHRGPHSGSRVRDDQRPRVEHARVQRLAPGVPSASASRTAKPPQVPPGTTASWLVYDRRAGKLVATRHAHRKFRSASVIKILIAIDFLDKRASLPAADARLLRVMLR